MGQCSTLPASRDKNSVRSSTSHSQSSYHSREQREAYDEGSRRHLDGDVAMGQYSQQHSCSNRNNDHFMDDGTSNSYHTANSSKSTKRRSLDPVHELHYEDFFPAPPLPDGALRTRCYRLNLDVPAVLSPTNDALGPFFYKTPDHLLPRAVSLDDDDMEEEKSATQIAIDTARIFRGIKVDNNGNIVGRNERSSRSRGKGQPSAKTAENSRQSAKIYKANDLVDEMVAGCGDENGGDKPNMVCIFPIGEYDDLKQMVRDGSKKLREADGLGDEQLLSLNSHRMMTSPSRHSAVPQLMSPPSMSRRASNDQSIMSSQSSASRYRTGNSESGSLKIRPSPRDHISSRRASASNNRGSNGGQSDWSESFNFNAFWNCGGAGKTSPVNHPPDVYNRRYRTEGRNESSRFSRGGSMSERDAPLMH